MKSYYITVIDWGNKKIVADTFVIADGMVKFYKHISSDNEFRATTSSELVFASPVHKTVIYSIENDITDSNI